jgi:hypothetical protein
LASEPASARHETSLVSRLARWALLGAIVVVCALLAWATSTRAIAHYYADTEPRRALAFDAGDPDARLNVANFLLMAKRNSRDLDAAEAQARRLLTMAPLETGALRDLGAIAEARTQNALAFDLMERAGRRGFRDVYTQSWLLRQALRTRDPYAASLRADALMRTSPDLRDRLFEALTSMVNDPGFIDPLSRRLAADPPWREPALIYLSQHCRDPRPVALLYQGLVNFGSPPNEQESGALLGRMTKDGRYEQAYLLWISYLPSRALGNLGDLYDGGFQGLPGSPPFNWNLAETPGVLAEMAKPGSGLKSGLHVEFPVDHAASLAEQLLVLPPGAYLLSGRFLLARPASGAHLQWTVTCAGAPRAPLATTRQNGDAGSAWATFSVAFSVPENCDAQWLSLVGLPGDGFGDLSAWYGDLAVNPVTSGTAAPAAPSTGGAS